MVARVGDRVLYTATAQDAERINRIRAQWVVLGNKPASWPQGAQAHVGSIVSPGEELGADVSLVHKDGSVGLRVLLDGNDTLWVPVARQGDGLGEWRPRE